MFFYQKDILQIKNLEKFKIKLKSLIQGIKMKLINSHLQNKCKIGLEIKLNL